jgi:hypothetical protein
MRPATGLCHLVPHPPGGFDWHMAGRRLASAISWRCFPGGHNQLQRQRPTADPAVPSTPSNAPEVHAPPPQEGLYPVVLDCEKTYRTARAGDLGAGIAQKLLFLKSPMYMAFSTATYPADRAVGPLSPLPCQAWHGCGISSAHHGEVRGCRRACGRDPLRGRRRCAAGGRQVHTFDRQHGVKTCYKFNIHSTEIIRT